MNVEDQHTILKTENLSIGYVSKKHQTSIASDVNITLQQGELVGLLTQFGVPGGTIQKVINRIPKVAKLKSAIKTADLGSFIHTFFVDF